MAQGSGPESIERARQLRRQQTPIEALLWKHLRAGQLAGYKFRRQHPIGKFIADFCCEEACLIVEVDGDTHAQNEAYDANRTAVIKSLGYRIIRFTNREVLGNINNVLEFILKECNSYGR
ncbi:MAG: endonuclease domain-containing protein [Armatimonadota bacterium]